MNYRIEHDLLGEREVPSDVYYGVHTLRALENFPISGIPISTYPNMVKAGELTFKCKSEEFNLDI